jgi:hypothetical protein
VFWRTGGTLRAVLTQPPSITCHDSEPLGGADVILSRGHKGWLVNLLGGFTVFRASARTRCLGPNLPNGLVALTGHVPSNLLTLATARIPLTHASDFTDDGYTARLVPHLTLVLTQRRIEHGTSTNPGGGYTTTTVSEGDSGSSSTSFSGSFFGSGGSSGSNGGGFFGP